eukprot:358951-Chlamydomonas_euryale.AAC.1
MSARAQGRVAFVDSSRVLVGVALKSLGLSANAGSPELQAAGVSAEQVNARVAELRSHALLFSNRDHIRALTAGATTIGTTTGTTYTHVYACVNACMWVIHHPSPPPPPFPLPLLPRARLLAATTAVFVTARLLLCGAGPAQR